MRSVYVGVFDIFSKTFFRFSWSIVNSLVFHVGDRICLVENVSRSYFKCLVPLQSVSLNKCENKLFYNVILFRYILVIYKFNSVTQFKRRHKQWRPFFRDALMEVFAMHCRQSRSTQLFSVWDLN